MGGWDEVDLDDLPKWALGIHIYFFLILVFWLGNQHELY